MFQNNYLNTYKNMEPRISGRSDKENQVHPFHSVNN